MASPLRAPPPPTVEVVAVTDDYAVAVIANALLVHFRRGTPLDVVEACRTGMRRIDARAVVFFGVIELDSDRPDDRTRAAFTRFFEEEARRLAAAVIVAKGEGFRGAMIRTIVSGIFSLAPSFRLGFPRHVVATLDEGGRRASPLLVGTSHEALVAAFEELAAAPARR